MGSMRVLCLLLPSTSCSALTSAVSQQRTPTKCQFASFCQSVVLDPAVVFLHPYPELDAIPLNTMYTKLVVVQSNEASILQNLSCSSASVRKDRPEGSLAMSTHQCRFCFMHGFAVQLPCAIAMHAHTQQSCRWQCVGNCWLSNDNVIH